MGDKGLLSDVETVLDRHAAGQHLEALADAGCNRTELLTVMELALFADESWNTLVGRDLRAFKRAIDEIRACATLIEGLNRSELVYHVAIEISDPGFAGIHDSPTMSERLRDYANKLDFLRVIYGPNRAIRKHSWKAWFVAHVIEDTKRPHDLEVSSLIAAILDESYSDKAHQAWRLTYVKLIEGMREKLLQHRRKRQPSLDRQQFARKTRRPA